jgi:hypothetical protein
MPTKGFDVFKQAWQQDRFIITNVTSHVAKSMHWMNLIF